MYATIVVGTDGTETAKAAVAHAAGLAKLTGATLHVVCVRREPPLSGSPEFIASGFDPQAAVAELAEATLDDALRDVRASGVSVVTHDPPGPVAPALVGIAEYVGADLIVVGNRGMQGTRRLLGSVPNSVTHQASCNVLVVQTT